MNKTVACFIMAVALFTMILFPAEKGLAGSDSIFLPEIERAVDEAIAAWVKEDTRKLETAMERLTLNETYLLAVGKSGRERSYLALVPNSLSHNFNAVAAYLFLIRKEREGTRLWPVSFFEGQRFQFEQKGGR